MSDVQSCGISEKGRDSMTIRCVYIGNYTAPWCTEVHIARDLEAIGCKVDRIQEPNDPGHHIKTVRRLRYEIGDAPNKPDLLLWTRTWGLHPSATQDLWRWAESNGIVTASYHLDLYLGLQREAAMMSDPFWTTQHVFTPDGNEASEAEFARRGINHHWMPPAIVSDECVPGQFREEYAHDVVFVGSRGYHKEWPWRVELIDGLKAHYGDRFAHYGGEGLPTVRSGFHNGELEEGLWLNDLYRSAKVVVGDTLNLPGNTKYISDRYFEVMGRGGCLLAPWVPVLGDLGFADGNQLYTYTAHERTVPAVCEHVDRILEMSTHHTQTVRAAAQTFVRENHTYRQRLAEALRIMGLS